MRMITVAALAIIAMACAPAAAGAGGARLYEMTENMKLTKGKFERRKATSELIGTADVGTPLCPKALVELYARLTASGKAHNVALIACARKLLIYANTVVERGMPWTEKPIAV